MMMPRPLEALLRYGGRLFIAAAIAWTVIEGMALYRGEPSKTGAYLASTDLSASTQTSGTTSAGSSSQAVNTGPTPYALVCIPTDHVLQFRNGNAPAVEYEQSIQIQLGRVLDDLNAPDSRRRQADPGKGFVILVHKREARYTPKKAEAGLMSLTTAFAYAYQDRTSEEYCPPHSLRSASHPRHRPEFANSSYEAEWHPVPALGKQ
jgi:hypothetical protein